STGVPGAPQALKSAVTELSEGITVTADVGTNSLVVQASKEAFNTIEQVIDQLDIRRPQVLVEALIMEVDVESSMNLGFSALVETFNGNTAAGGGSITGGRPRGSDSAVVLPEVGQALTGLGLDPLNTFFGAFTRDTRDANGQGSLIQGIITASAGNSDTNIVASPHILTTDNEEAEIKIGKNIPIITSSQQNDDVTSVNRVNVERQDIGVTLRVTPQISEGDSLRLEIYQEITKLTPSSEGNEAEVGPTLLNRSVENTVVVKDGQTVVIGGLLDEQTTEKISKVPFLGDIPFLGWAFKSTSEEVIKTNLLIFLTPHIVRSAEDMEMETIRKREEFRYYSKTDEGFDKRLVEELGVDLPDRSIDPARRTLNQLDKKYPLEDYKKLQQLKHEEHEKRMRKDAQGETQYMLLAAVYEDETLAANTLTQLIDGGYDGSLIAEEAGGSILYRIVLGPYHDLHAAEATSDSVREVFGLTPSVLLEHLESEQDEP
ncbi:MAG: hypothetical protein JRC77_02780, partial [Deltaproteobacteria bacterium]|nr:hypothetical protein [Deltaproteobacteria bacterium]